MERLTIPEHYQRPKTDNQNELGVSELSEWIGLPYHPNPNCPACKGAGFVHPRRGEQIVHAEEIPCSAPGCLQENIRRSITGETVTQTFDTFAPVPGTEKALKAARALASGKAEFIWLLIYGRPGNGKTHICNAIVRAVRDRDVDVRTVLAADLFSLLREAIKDNKADQMLRRFKDIQFLAIDDYGVEYGSDWEQAKMDELITSRYMNALPTVLITNKDLSELPERLRSRFNDKVVSRIIHNTAPDYRTRRNT